MSAVGTDSSAATRLRVWDSPGITARRTTEENDSPENRFALRSFS